MNHNIAKISPIVFAKTTIFAMREETCSFSPTHLFTSLSYSPYVVRFILHSPLQQRHSLSRLAGIPYTESYILDCVAINLLAYFATATQDCVLIIVVAQMNIYANSKVSLIH